jgi:hypothetical protein
MSAVFISQTLQTLYGSVSNAVTFRTDGADKDDSDVRNLDLRIASFEKLWIDSNSKPGDYPYDRAGLQREFMDEVLALMLERRTGTNYFQSITVTYNHNSIAGNTTTRTYNPFIGNDTTKTLKDVDTTLEAVTDYTPVGYTVNQVLIPNPRNFADLTDAQKRDLLNDQGKAVWDHYMDLITEVFKQGDKLNTPPIDPTTGTTVKSNVVTSIPEVVYNSVTYDRVTTINGQVYLVKKGATTYDITKTVVQDTGLNPADFQLGFTPGTATDTDYLAVDANLQPTGVVVTLSNQRNLSPVHYLYYWTEARIKVLRSKLAFKEAVTSEIRDDLAKAQAVYADLEKLAGQTRAQSEDGKTMNPNLSDESMLMDLWEARVSKSGEQILETGGSDDKHNYTEWSTNRSRVKTYIDLKSTQSQDAMLDYQTTLNRFNNAYEIMSKLQEKMDGLVKSQLRNVG